MIRKRSDDQHQLIVLLRVPESHPEKVVFKTRKISAIPDIHTVGEEMVEQMVKGLGSGPMAEDEIGTRGKRSDPIQPVEQIKYSCPFP